MVQCFSPRNPRELLVSLIIKMRDEKGHVPKKKKKKKKKLKKKKKKKKNYFSTKKK